MNESWDSLGIHVVASNRSELFRESCGSASVATFALKIHIDQRLTIAILSGCAPVSYLSKYTYLDKDIIGKMTGKKISNRLAP